MKKNLFYLFIVVFILIFNSCSPETATISGTIEGNDSTVVLFGDQIIHDHLDTIKVTNGKFSQKIEMENAGYYVLVVGNQMKQIFLGPNYDLNIKTTFPENLDTPIIEFSGKGEIENNMLQNIMQSIDQIDYEYLDKIDKNQIITYIDSIFNQFSSSFEKMIKGKNLDPNFVNFQNKYCKFKAATLKLILGLQNGIDDPRFYNFIDSLELDNAQYLAIPDFRMFIQYYTEKLLNDQLVDMNDTIKAKPEVWITKKLKVISTFENVKIKEYLYFSAIKQVIEYEGLEGFELCRSTYEKELKNDTYRDQIKLMLNKKMDLAKGKPAFDFTCYDTNDKEVHLSDFKGKVIYLDFWATWCTPCKEEKPYFVELSKQYKNKEIVFISLSLDDPDKFDEWKKMTQNEKSIVHLRTHTGWDPKLVEKFQLISIPTFMLIDANGNFIDATAPRPSTKEIIPILNQLVQ
ncbi:MAG: TlpA family protein disulfide reductase [Bacteroidetes bacterium]|nr:TlpA family protein disulfide reductase [Bacteroidota bacterium]